MNHQRWTLDGGSGLGQGNVLRLIVWFQFLSALCFLTTDTVRSASSHFCSHYFPNMIDGTLQTVAKISPLLSCFKYLGTEKRKLTNKATKLTFPIGTSKKTPSSGHSGWISVIFDYEDLASLLQTDVQKLLQTETQMPEILFRLKDYKDPSPLIAEQDDV